ncbi:MAG TPA: hypothetical protein PKI93_08055 [Alphaproteobacteria bacterium]|nr:hypothetical protein [Alphaproteobacteria bacterium]HNS45289.1 hypothetical protein [Alphaproteobacteria bacterium]
MDTASNRPTHSIPPNLRDDKNMVLNMRGIGLAELEVGALHANGIFFLGTLLSYTEDELKNESRGYFTSDIIHKIKEAVAKVGDYHLGQAQALTRLVRSVGREDADAIKWAYDIQKERPAPQILKELPKDKKYRAKYRSEWPKIVLPVSKEAESAQVEAEPDAEMQDDLTTMNPEIDRLFKVLFSPEMDDDLGLDPDAEEQDSDELDVLALLDTKGPKNSTRKTKAGKLTQIVLKVFLPPQGDIPDLAVKAGEVEKVVRAHCAEIFMKAAEQRDGYESDLDCVNAAIEEHLPFGLSGKYTPPEGSWEIDVAVELPETEYSWNVLAAMFNCKNRISHLAAQKVEAVFQADPVLAAYIYE